MPRPTRIEFPGALYFISINAMQDVTIFRDDIDRQRFLQILDFSVRRYSLKLHAFVMMNDGYRLLVETPMANLTKSIQYINSHYMAYLNTRRGSGGGRIFAGRYTSPVVQKDRHLLELARYIHLIPVYSGVVTHPSRYKWSSYAFYSPQVSTPDVPNVSTDDVLRYFEGSFNEKQQGFQAYTEDGVSASPGAIRDMVRKKRFIGDRDFARWAENQQKNSSTPSELPASHIIRKTAQYHSVTRESIIDNRTKPNIPRNVAIYLCRNITSTSLEDLGDLFGVGPSSICNTAKRVEAYRKSDSELEKILREVELKVREEEPEPETDDIVMQPHEYHEEPTPVIAPADDPVFSRS